VEDLKSVFFWGEANSTITGILDDINSRANQKQLNRLFYSSGISAKFPCQSITNLLYSVLTGFASMGIESRICSFRRDCRLESGITCSFFFGLLCMNYDGSVGLYITWVGSIYICAFPGAYPEKMGGIIGALRSISGIY
jgi:hypothetical protein